MSIFSAVGNMLGFGEDPTTEAARQVSELQRQQAAEFGAGRTTAGATQRGEGDVAASYRGQIGFAASQSQEARRREEALYNRILAGGPSAAEQQMQMGVNQAQAQAAAIAASQRGNSMLAARQAQQAQGQIAQQAIGQAGMLRAQEEAQRNQLAAGLSTQIRQQDFGLGGLYGTQAGLANQARAFDVQRELGYLQAQQGAVAGQAAGTMAAGQAESLQNAASLQLASSIGAMAAGSDRRNKQDIESGDAAIGRFLDAIRASEYEYRDDPSHRRLGVMAQDLERTPEGRSMVTDTPRGKMVNTPQATMAALAALASLHDRVKALEGKRGRRARTV